VTQVTTIACIAFVLAGCAGAPEQSDTTRAAGDTAAVVEDSSSPRADTNTAARRDSATFPSATTLTAEGWGPLRIGMTRAQVVAAAGPDANPSAVGGPDPESCDQFRPRSAPQGLLVMIERDTLTRISMSRSSAIRTDAGFAVGDSAGVVLRHYGARAAVTPHKYQSAPAKYLTVWARGRPPASSARGIVYEIGGDDRVMHIHAGGPSIQYVEGCS
jgi:hypothetical protein